MSNSFVTPWTVACQAPLSMGFPRQEYWNRLPFPSPGDLPNPGIEPVSPAFAGRFLTIEPPGKTFLTLVKIGTSCKVYTQVIILAKFYIYLLLNHGFATLIRWQLTESGNISHSVVSDSLQPHGL